MKALIRNPGEIVTEDMGVPGIDWNTGMPLTCQDWAGGPYILVNDYVPEDPVDDFDPTPARRKAKGATCGCTNPSAASQPADAPAQDPPADTIVIDGVTYTRTS